MKYPTVTVLLVSLLVGIITALLLFFGLWSAVDILLEILAVGKAGVVREIAWTLSYFLPFIVVAVITTHYFNKYHVHASPVFTFPVCIPTIFLLYLFAGITDAPEREYIPRLIWVIAPGAAYAIGLSIKLFNNQEE